MFPKTIANFKLCRNLKIGLFSAIILVFSNLSCDSVIIFPSLNAVSHKVIFLQGTLFYFLTSLYPHLSYFFEYNISGKKIDS